MANDSDEAPPARGMSKPWSFAINETAIASDAAVSLMAVTVVGDILRILGLIVIQRPALGLSAMPTWSWPPTMAHCHPFRGEVVPHGLMTFVTWAFGRPRGVTGRYVARIGSLDLGAQPGHTETVIEGPWRFAFAWTTSARNDTEA